MTNSKELTLFPSWAAGRAGYAARIKQMFKEYLQNQSLHWTPQRMSILDYLLSTDHHASQEEIYKVLKEKKIGKVTVFRTLKMLEKSGIVERVSAPPGPDRYEVKSERPHHDHLICLSCGAIVEVEWPEIEKLQKKACREKEFKVTYHRHEVFGICKNCQRTARG